MRTSNVLNSILAKYNTNTVIDIDQTFLIFKKYLPLKMFILKCDTSKNGKQKKESINMNYSHGHRSFTGLLLKNSLSNFTT